MGARLVWVLDDHSTKRVASFSFEQESVHTCAGYPIKKPRTGDPGLFPNLNLNYEERIRIDWLMNPEILNVLSYPYPKGPDACASGLVSLNMEMFFDVLSYNLTVEQVDDAVCVVCIIR